MLSRCRDIGPRKFEPESFAGAYQALPTRHTANRAVCIDVRKVKFMEQTKPSCSFAISSDGTAAPLMELPALDVAPESTYVWTHLHVMQDGGREWLADEAKLDSSIVAALMAAETRHVPWLSKMER